MAQLYVRNIRDAFGAEITGLDPRSDFDGETRRVLRQLFDQRGLLLFAGIDIDFEYQDKLCRMLIGDDGPGTAGQRDPIYVSNREPGGYAPYGRLMFHADMMWHPQPFQVLSLYAVNVEPGCATTTVASGTCAWELLPASLRARVDGHHALHSTGQVYSRGGDDLLRPEREHEESSIKPIAYRHPRTGKTILYVSQQMTREIVGLPHDESEELLQALFSHLYGPATAYEHTWRTGDLLVFDNIAMQHARGNVDLNGPTRTLRKVIAPIPKLSIERPRYTKPGEQKK
jgi:alpha-ketoglutarate-dependent taurine dioxygenase